MTSGGSRGAYPPYKFHREPRRVSGRVSSTPEALRPAAQLLGNHFVNRLDLFDSDQFLIESAVEVGELVRVEPELMQDRSVQVLHADRVLDRAAAQFVRGTDS